MAKYSSSQVLEITNVQLMMVNDSLPLEAACRIYSLHILSVVN